MADTVITVDKLSKKFNDNIIFKDCSLTIEKGVVFGLVGLNGSGKTTFFRILLGLLKPQDGRVRVLGHDPWKHEPSYFKKLGVILDHDGFAGNLTVRDNLLVFGKAKGASQPDIEAYVDRFWKGTFLCDEFFSPKKKVKYFSRGQKMQCAICRAFLGSPPVLFLDEPTVALDVEAIDHFYSLVNHARAEGATVLISSHHIAAIEDLCDLVGLLRDKSIADLDLQTNDSSSQPWYIRCDGKEQSETVIQLHSKTPVEYYNNAWHFEVVNPQTAIPIIVSDLVSQGIKVLEVSTEKDSLKNKIRLRNGIAEKI